ncbi:DUF6691 family protein [Pseudahrensia aquimaris]|uniref:DUF6691 family protein n=1 Tax=Pseudahrensia aquimaris TaxID=744461 RepID=A0ABW3FGG0_9HYPH
MRSISALIAGLIFGLGLGLSGMTNPAKVQNFLDLFGTWDPSLAFVMGGAIAVTAPGYFLLKKLAGQPLFAEKFQFPTRKDIDAPLLGGAATFGIGWGLGGFCPGPALAALPLSLTNTTSVLVFVVSMLVGMWLANSRTLAKAAIAENTA